MIEPIDDKFISIRVNGMFESDGGFLWKCVYGEGGMADLKTDGGNSVPEWKMNWDQDMGMWDDHWGNGNNFYLYFNTGSNNFFRVKTETINNMQ